MSALGEILVIVIYLILCIPILMVGLRLLLVKKLFKRHYVWLIGSAVPVFIFGYFQYSHHREAALAYVGKYRLTSTATCNEKILELEANYSFKVYCDEEMVENGTWKYKSGGDYWIVYIGKGGRLGSGEFEYDVKINE